MADGDSHQFGNILLGGKNQHREENTGILKMHQSGFGWKSRKTGQVVAISKADLRGLEWLKIPHAYQLKLRAKGGFVYQFNGLKSQDKETVKTFCKTTFDQELEESKISYKGWNWGEASIESTSLCFRVGADSAFDVPLNDITQATAQKNEAVIEMADDDTALPEDEMLVELRLHVPVATGDDVAVDESAAEAFVATIKQSGDLEAAGSTLCDFKDVPVQVPRGRYDIELFDKYMKLHGKTYDYKVLYTNVASLYLLPKQDGYHMALIVSLEHPLRQGATGYPHILLQLPKEAPQEVTINLDEEELSRRFGDKLEPNESGDMPDVFAKVFSAFTKKKVQQIKASGFNGASEDDKAKSIRCSMKANDGFLYPLEKGFFFIGSKPVFLAFDKVASVEFERVNKAASGSSAARTFDITVHPNSREASEKTQFVNLARSDYKELARFLSDKKIKIKNFNSAAAADDDGDSDDGGGAMDEDDPYMNRVASKRQRSQQSQQEGDDDDDDDDDDEESEDADFAPGGESDVDEEYEEGNEAGDDERAFKKKKKKEEKGSDDSGDGSGSGSDDEDKPVKAPPAKKAKKEKAEKASPSGKAKKPRKKKDKAEPKRALSAYMFYVNGNRARINAENPGIKVTEIGKIAGAEWKALDAEARAPWDAKAAEDKERATAEMKAYKEAKRAAAAADDSDSDAAPASASKPAADDDSDSD